MSERKKALKDKKGRSKLGNKWGKIPQFMEGSFVSFSVFP
jgi:hypothetical protein